MSCESIQDLISPLLDRQLAGDERDGVVAHLDVCRVCRTHLESIQTQRKQLRAMSAAPMPAGLATRLRVAASYERERRLMRASLSLRLQRWYAGLKLFSDNLMRPLAVPFAGGVTSTVVCFGLLISMLSFPHDFRDATFFTAPHGSLVAQGPNGMFVPSNVRIEPLEAENPDNAIIVELTIDESGRVSDWSMVRGKMTLDMEELIMFSKFSPAMYLGLPTWGKVKAVQSIPSRTMRS
jgi:anti-sigma factor RsiW